MTTIADSLDEAVEQNRDAMFDMFRRGVASAAEFLQGESDIDQPMLIRFCVSRDALIDEYSASVVADNNAQRRHVECAVGCDHCCKQHVMISTTEAFHLAFAAPDPALLRHHVAAFAERITGLDHAARFGIACPLLVNHRCSLYAQRPQTCRTHFSLSRRACAYEKTSPNLAPPKLAGVALYYAFDYTLSRVSEFPVQMVMGELSVMLEAALAPGAFTAWAEGAQVFPAKPFRPSTRSTPEQTMPYPMVLDAMARNSGADTLLHVERRSG